MKKSRNSILITYLFSGLDMDCPLLTLNTDLTNLLIVDMGGTEGVSPVEKVVIA
jgi:hypothetical protein